METSIWTVVSAALMLFWAVRYIYLAWHRRAGPNPVSWLLWSVIWPGLWLTADSSEANEVYFTALIAAFSPPIISFVIRYRAVMPDYHWTKRNKQCAWLAIVGFGLYLVLGANPELAQWSLYWMIGVELVVLLPTLDQVYRKPLSDVPLPWVVFGLSYGVTGFMITEHTVANWSLPIYMFGSCLAVATPLIYRRLIDRIPLRDWW